MFVKPKYVVPKPDGTGFREKADSDSCLHVDKVDLLADAPSMQPQRPMSAPCKPSWEKLAQPVLIFGSGLSDSEDEGVIITPSSS